MASPLELLPRELIQEIFRLSLNINLPIASPVIADKLATKYCYILLCQSYLLRDIRYEGGLKYTQSWIFERRWMTWEFFQDFIAYICNGNVNKRVSFTTLKYTVAETNDQRCIWGKDVDNRMIRLLSCKIPKKLIHGPWTKSKIDFLRFLVTCTAMKVDWADRNTRVLISEGKRQAITEKSYEAVELFCNSRILGRAPSISHVKFAVKEAGCDRTIVYTLMTSARKWGHRRWVDVELDAWVNEARKRNDPKGDWLALKLNELRIPGGFLSPDTGDYEAVGDALSTAFYDSNTLSAAFSNGQHVRIILLL